MRHVFLFLTIIGIIQLLLPVLPASADDKLFDPYRQMGIVVAQESDMPPMSFLEVNGQPKGYLIDLWRKWSAETGVPVRFHLVDWADTLTAVRDGKADVHGGLFFTDERDAYLDYSSSFFPSKGGFFVSKDSDVKDIFDLEGKKVGVINKSFYDTYMKRVHPTFQPVRIQTTAELAEMASRGEIEAFLGDYPTIMYQIGTTGKSGAFKVVDFVTEQRFHAAVAEGNTQLLHMVEQGLALIDEDERSSIFKRWIIGEDERSMGWLLPAIFISVLSLLIALIVPFVFRRVRG